MPINILKGETGLASHVLRLMFEARKRVFVDLLRWDVPVLDNRYEIDQFDDAHATYLIVSDPTGAHLASCRLLPTLRPHILGSLFAELCDGPAPVGPHIYEITRFCLDRSLSGTERREARNRLVSAIADYATAHGITSYTGVAEAGWLHQIQRFGWNCMQLGAIKHSGNRRFGQKLGALRIDIDADTVSGLILAGIYRDVDAGFALPKAA